MSNLPPAGVFLVAENYDPYMRALTNATAAVEKFNTSAGKAASTGGNQFTQQMGAGVKVANSFSTGALIMANVVGNVVTNALGAAWNMLGNFKDQAISAVSTMQDMKISLESLAAREILYAKGADDINTALEMGAPIAARMMEEIKKLSIDSPFHYSQVLSVFQMNMAFGMTSDMALKLTKSITDLGALSQNIPGILQRLSYNFAQMSMTGQITQRDVRDLAMAGLDLAKVFDLTLGKSVQEVNDDLKSGKITFAEVSTALVNYTDKYIGPAAQRASRTLTGLMSTFSELGTFTFGNLFMDSVQQITDVLGTMLDKAVAFADSDAMKATGQVLSFLTGKFMSFATGIGDAAMVYGQNIGLFKQHTEAQLSEVDEMNVALGKTTDHTQGLFYDKMAAIAGNAFDWGAGIVTALADGMIQAASSVLIAVIDAIASMLTFWMSPGSPPRMLPDLTKWGFGAITAYLEGFTQADFSILNSLESPLKSALGFFEQIGSISKGSADKILGDLSKGIIAGLSGEGDLQKLLADIESEMGPFGEEMAQLVEQNFALAAATDAAAEAQKKLIDAQKAEVEAGRKVADGVKEYNDMLRSGASKEELKAKLANINADRKAQGEAAKARGEAEKSISAAEDNMKVIKEQIQLQQDLVNQMIELAKLQAGDAAKKAGGGGGGGGGGAKLPGGGGGGGGGKNPMESILEQFKLQLGKNWDEAWAPFINKWNTEWLPAVDKVKGKWTELVNLFKNSPLGKTLQEVIDKIKAGDWAGAWSVISTSFDNWLFDSWAQGTYGEKIATIVIDMWNKGIAAVDWGAVWTSIVTFFVAGFSTVDGVEGWGIVGGRMLLNLIAGVVANLVSFGITIGEAITGVTQEQLIAMWAARGVTTASEMMTYLGEQITTWWETNVMTYMSKVVTDIVDGFKTDIIQRWGTDIPALAQTIMQILVDMLIAKWAALTATNPFVSLGKTVIDGLVAGINNIGPLVAAIKAAIAGAIAAATGTGGLNAHSPSKVFTDIGETIPEGTAKGVEIKSTMATKAVESMVNQTIHASVNPPRTQASITRTGPTVNVQMGNISISNQAEGDMFQRRVELAVLHALGS